MTLSDPSYAAKVQHAQEKLETAFLRHPDVSLIDTGYLISDGQPHDQIALRLHVSARWLQTPPEQRVAFPEQVDGIPVVIIVADYQAEAENDTTS